jgi:2OG-Fe(II) oxygenase superfamily
MSETSTDFIEVYEDALDRATCEKLVERFTASDSAQPGRSGGAVRTEVKDSLDITISDMPEWRDVEVALNNAVIKGVLRYAKRYPHLVLGPFAMSLPSERSGKPRLAEAADLEKDETLRTQFVTSVLRPGRINLQRYIADKGGYPRWHSELYPMVDHGESLHRVVLWTIYLNDGFEAGETEFLYQRRKITPRAGSLLIAPASFTHTHRGNRPRGSDKFIATSWILFWRAERLYTAAPAR